MSEASNLNALVGQAIDQFHHLAQHMPEMRRRLSCHLSRN
jgi:hypothetical protein